MYTLLAHRKNGREALVQHTDTGEVYRYRFPALDAQHYFGWAQTRSYELVTDHESTVDQNEWDSDYKHKHTFASMDGVHVLIKNYSKAAA